MGQTGVNDGIEVKRQIRQLPTVGNSCQFRPIPYVSPEFALIESRKAKSANHPLFIRTIRAFKVVPAGGIEPPTKGL